MILCTVYYVSDYSVVVWYYWWRTTTTQKNDYFVGLYTYKYFIFSSLDYWESAGQRSRELLSNPYF